MRRSDQIAAVTPVDSADAVTDGGHADIRALERRIAAVAHEIRSPLNGLIALTDNLLASGLTPEQRRQADAIRAAADHLFAVSRDVLEAARLQETGVRLDAGSFSFDEMMSAIGASFTARAAMKQIVFDIDCAPDIPARLVGDAVRLRQMIENLADNALKMTDRGRVSLTATATPGVSHDRVRLTITVNDTGPGLGAGDTETIFDAYRQGANARGGIGLGLSLVRSLAEAMNGSVFASNRQGGGAAIGFTVLLGRAADGAAESEETAAAPRPTGPLRILVVEDNPVNRVVIGTILDQFGHRHDMVADGAAAVAAVARGSYDLVLMDRKMPGLDGLSATRAIRALPEELARVPVIGVTAGAFAHEIDEFRSAGADAVVTKPVSVRALWAAIEDAFGTGRRAA